MATQRNQNSKDIRGEAVGRIAVALIAAWVALVAIPQAIPWDAKDDAARALAYGVAASSAIAILAVGVGIWPWRGVSDGVRNQAPRIGASVALIALAIAALEVAYLTLLPILVPADSPYRQIATGIGLLILLLVASGAIAGLRSGFLEGFKLSSLTLAGTIAAIALIVMYLVIVQSLFGRTGESVKDAEWVRLTTLLSGLQALAFAAAGALLGTAVQGQVTSRVKADLDGTESANAELEGTVKVMKKKVEHGQLVEVNESRDLTHVFTQLLGQDKLQDKDAVKSEVERIHRSTFRPSTALASELEGTLERSRRLRKH